MECVTGTLRRFPTSSIPISSIREGDAGRRTGHRHVINWRNQIVFSVIYKSRNLVTKSESFVSPISTSNQFVFWRKFNSISSTIWNLPIQWGTVGASLPRNWIASECWATMAPAVSINWNRHSSFTEWWKNIFVIFSFTFTLTLAFIFAFVRCLCISLCPFVVCHGSFASFVRLNHIISIPYIHRRNGGGDEENESEFNGYNWTNRVANDSNRSTVTVIRCEPTSSMRCRVPTPTAQYKKL